MVCNKGEMAPCEVVLEFFYCPFNGQGFLFHSCIPLLCRDQVLYTINNGVLFAIKVLG